MTLPEIDQVSFLVEHAQTFFAGESQTKLDDLRMSRPLFLGSFLEVTWWALVQ